MTALGDDCFAYGGERIGLRSALDLLRERIDPVVGVETVPLHDAVGRVLARPVVAPRDVPAFDNVAVDGWAFAWTGEPPLRRRVAEGRAAAGHPFCGPVPAGHCVRALTGAPLPDGTDTVALQEEVRLEDGWALLPVGLKRGANRRRRGEDIALGTTVLAAGTVLGAPAMGTAAETGAATLEVHAHLRVAIFSTGDEIVEPGRILPDGGVYDANRAILRGLLAGLPVEVTDLGILPDTADAVGTALAEAAAGHDLLLTSGGASRGDEDHVVRAAAALGQLDFWQIAMKPGRPLAFGRLGRSVFVGLPGNPVAVVACFLMLARPVLLRLAGAAWTLPRRYPVTAGFDLVKKPGRTELVRARLEIDARGRLVARKIVRQGSGVLTTLLEAHGFVELDEQSPGVAAGDSIPFLSLTELSHCTE